jgi:hypothetical protein
MIHMFTAHTEEIDDVERAVEEIVNGLSLEGKLKQNTIGILHCYYEFIDSGVVRELSQRLPFDVVGLTTNGASTHGFMSTMGLTLSVLTSDTVQFPAGVSAPIDDSLENPVTELYERLTSPLTEKPELILTFVPFLYHITGDEFANKINELSGGIPAFGALPISDKPDFSESYTIFNGEAYLSSLVLVCLAGDVRPTLLSVSSPEENMLSPRSIVTGSKGNILLSVNGMPADEYIASVGLAEKNNLVSLISTPFVAELENGAKLVRSCLKEDGKGGAILCGHIPVGAKLGFAMLSSADIVRMTGATVSKALAMAQ